MNASFHPTVHHALSRPARGVLAAVLAVALALALAGDASAAAGLTASENPVVIPYANTTKTVTLSWDLGGAGSAILTVKDDLQADVLVQFVITQTGSMPLTVTYGRTYTAKLVNSSTQAVIGSPLTITTKRPLVKFDFGCLVQCISSVGVDAHGTFAGFSITTNETVYMTLTVNKATASGGDCIAGAVAGTQTTILPVTSWAPQITGLEAGKLHRWSVQATDANGNKQSKSGCFSTLKRRVAVTFEKVTVNDDSDGFGAGACDCRFYFWAGSNAAGTFYPSSGEVSVDSGDSFHPYVTITVDGAPASLALGATGNDDDEDLGNSCQYGSPTSGSGSDTCHDWASASTTAGTSVSGPGEAFTGSFHMSTGGALAFEVWGVFKVTYVP